MNGWQIIFVDVPIFVARDIGGLLSDITFAELVDFVSLDRLFAAKGCALTLLTLISRHMEYCGQTPTHQLPHSRGSQLPDAHSRPQYRRHNRSPAQLSAMLTSCAFGMPSPWPHGCSWARTVRLAPVLRSNVHSQGRDRTARTGIGRSPRWVSQWGTRSPHGLGGYRALR